MNNTKKMVVLSLITAQAIVIHYIESFLPVLIPGIKLGLANIMTMVTIALFGFGEALLVVIIRCVLGSLLAGNPMSILYSLTGGILSCIVIWTLYRYFGKYFSLIAISVAGALFHNVGQLLVASVVFGTIGIFFTYIPILASVSVITGFFIGLVSIYILQFLPKFLTNH
ncbi:MAG: Gx transporter family protein [Xylanivirga thermophila]|jgi:heptaprenyl diphosphate synthase|uniref:Gx transporter family protein n=1 Tax=Xylanivirga thermophila TaxID=2496273 RepID=UPI00101E0B32|nr:Gx transporter family protein [Xylanivirga thermophila]